MLKEIRNLLLIGGGASVLSACDGGPITQKQIEDAMRGRVPITRTVTPAETPEPTLTPTATPTFTPTPVPTSTPIPTETPTLKEYFLEQVGEDWEIIKRQVYRGDVGPDGLPSLSQAEMGSKMAATLWSCRSDRDAAGTIWRGADVFARYPRIVNDLNNRLPPEAEECDDTAWVLRTAAECFREGEDDQNQAAYSFFWWFEEEADYSEEERRKIMRDIIGDQCETMLNYGEE